MTAKAKVLATYPDAYAVRYTVPSGSRQRYAIYDRGDALARASRESWAWADAYRNLKSEDAG